MKPNPPLSEKDLLDMLRQPDQQRQAFGILVSQYSEQLYWQIRRIVLNHDDADDVMQNTFLKAWNRLDSFQGESKILTWLSRIAINESLDFLRRNNHPTVSTEDESSISLTLQADPYFDGSEVEAMLQEAIATLPDVQRSVFLMRYYDEMKYSEISQILNTSEGALKASYHIAVKKIADFFKARD
jgi:RNA polymerase sigma-70 factor (ECF subfamily)